MKVADQIGSTYRKWANGTNKPEKKKDKKLKAIEWYSRIKKDYPNDFDNRMQYGFAMALLLKPTDASEIRNGVKVLINILKQGKDKGAISKLLELWDVDDTMERILLYEHELKESISNHQYNVLIEAIVNIAANKNCFDSEIYRTLQKLFKDRQTIHEIRLSICRYLMKYVIYRTYQSLDIEEISSFTKEIIEIIVNTEYDDRIDWRDYLSEFLGSVKGSYLEFFVKAIKEEIDDLQNCISRLDETTFKEAAKQLISDLRSLRMKLDDIQLIEDSVNIDEELTTKEHHYKAKAGHDINYIQNNYLEEETFISKYEWARLDDFLFETFDYLSLYAQDGKCELEVKCDETDVFLILSINSQEDVLGNIQNRFEELNIQDKKFIPNMQPGEIKVQIVFKKKGKRIEAPFKRLLEYSSDTYFNVIVENYWDNFKRMVKEEIPIDRQDVLDKIVRYTLSQIDSLITKAKGKIFIFANELHDIKHLIGDSVLTPDQKSVRINNIKWRFREIRFLTRSYLHPEREENTFSISDLLREIGDDFLSISDKDLNIEININSEENDKFHYYGNKDQIEMIFEELFDNAQDAIRKKSKDYNPAERYEPVIMISIKRRSIEDKLEILFEDNGVGCPAGSTVDGILVSTPSGDNNSTGFGLNIIKRIFENYEGGKFEISSSETGKDSHMKFLIELPAFSIREKPE